MSRKLKKNQIDSKYIRSHLMLEKHQKRWASRYGNISDYVRQLIEKDIELSTGQKD